MTAATGTATTAYGIFPSSNFAIMLRALRRNSVLSILAEPNLVAMSGHHASFLAGGQFPVPVPQTSGGIANSVTIEFKNFGVQLDFVPTVLDDETIRLSVYPEVSTIDFTLGTIIVPGGTPIPGLNTRRTSTTVEMRQGQTLAISGLLEVDMDAQTDRIPFLGDLPYIGPLFSNTHHKKTEKELLVMVTPVLVHPINCGEKLCLPGADIKDPTDCEFYFKERIEGRTGADFRATLSWDHECVKNQVRYEKRHITGPCGFSE
jgi:pilus assembly protein CpaC